jgi:hypothetical protein
MIDRSIALLIVFAVVFFAGGTLFSSPDRLETIQPIPFNHEVHASFAIECGDCHFRCEKNRDAGGDIECDACLESTSIFCEAHLACPDHNSAGVPELAVCVECHEDDDPDTPQKAALLSYVESGNPIPWKRISTLPGSNALFSHRRHALIGEIQCQECHGPMESMTEPPQQPPEEFGMDWCVECHQTKSVNEGCVACHR